MKTAGNDSCATRRSMVGHALTTFAALVLTSPLLASEAPPTWKAHAAPRLAHIWEASRTPASKDQNSAKTSVNRTGSTLRYDKQGRLQVEVTFDCALAAPIKDLTAIGMVIGTVVTAAPYCVAEGWTRISSVPAIAALSSVQFIDLPHYANHKAPTGAALPPRLPSKIFAATGSPAINGNGIAILQADKYLAQTGVNGAGITIGVISGDATNVATIEGRGELSTVKLIQPSSHPTTHDTLTDEGTVMLEEIYAVAPGANLAFCGPDTYTEYVACVLNLIAAGATIIADDITYTGFDVMSAQSAQTVAIQNTLTIFPGVMLFSAVGNNQQEYWQGNYAPVAASAPLSCKGQTDAYVHSFGTVNYQTWTLHDTKSHLVLLGSAKSSSANSVKFDLYVLDSSDNVVTCTDDFASSGSTNYSFIEDEKVASPGTYHLVIGSPDATSAGALLKLIGSGDGNESFSVITTGGVISPQNLAGSAFTIGAVNGADGIGDSVEAFSIQGPIALILPSPSTLQAPTLAAPDGIYVDATGTHFTTSNGSLFFGTSAASPNAAAIATLLRSTFPTLSAQQTIAAMESGAAQISGSSPNGASGYGRADALGALAALPIPAISTIAATTIPGGSTMTVPFSISGTGALSLYAATDNATLIPNGAPALAVDCGTTPGSCNLVITPTFGVSGVANITISSVDGAKRSATTMFAVTVTKPTPPTVGISSGATQSVTVGTGLAPVNFNVSGTQTLAVSAASSNVALLPATGIALSAGCGTAAAMSCTATLTSATGQTGTSTVTFTVIDPYGQTANGTAVVTVNAVPGKGGGGELDLVGIAMLTSLWLIRRWRQARGVVPH